MFQPLEKPVHWSYPTQYMQYVLSIQMCENLDCPYLLTSMLQNNTIIIFIYVLKMQITSLLYFLKKYFYCPLLYPFSLSSLLVQSSIMNLTLNNLLFLLTSSLQILILFLYSAFNNWITSPSRPTRIWRPTQPWKSLYKSLCHNVFESIPNTFKDTLCLF